MGENFTWFGLFVWLLGLGVFLRSGRKQVELSPEYKVTMTGFG